MANSLRFEIRRAEGLDFHTAENAAEPHVAVYISDVEGNESERVADFYTLSGDSGTVCSGAEARAMGYINDTGMHPPKTPSRALSRTTGRVEYAVLDVDGTWATEVHDVPNDVTTMDALSTWPHDNLDKIASLRGRYNDIAGFAVLDSDSSEESEE